MVKFEGLRDLEKAFHYAEEIERRINSPEVEDGVAGLFQMPMYLVCFACIDYSTRLHCFLGIRKGVLAILSTEEEKVSGNEIRRRRAHEAT